MCVTSQTRTSVPNIVMALHRNTVCMCSTFFKQHTVSVSDILPPAHPQVATSHPDLLLDALEAALGSSDEQCTERGGSALIPMFTVRRGVVMAVVGSRV